jgi:hypothetical protein
MRRLSCGAVEYLERFLLFARCLQPLEDVPAPVRFHLCQPAAWSSPRSTGPSPGEPRSPLAIQPHVG